MNNIFPKLIKIDRISAWILLIVILLYGLTGYGMVTGLINYNLASTWHMKILGVFGLISLVFHTGFATHLALKRWRVWDKGGKIIWALAYILIIGFFVYVGVFYKASNTLNTKINNNNAIGVTQNLKVFTATELAKYNGLNGEPAYVAVDGLVYDLSAVFRNGDHHGFSAGQDQSLAFHSHHDSQILNRFTVVGRY